MSKRMKVISRLVISVSGILLLMLSACGPPEWQAVPPSSGNTTEGPPSADNTTAKLSPPYAPPPKEGVALPPAPQPDKGNEKLDSFLNQLIVAEKQGGAEAFARQRNVQLVDDKVRVQIDAKPGQLDIAANVTAKFGTVEIISRSFNAVSAVVPITSLTALAEEDSIRGIGIPISPTNT